MPFFTYFCKRIKRKRSNQLTESLKNRYDMANNFATRLEECMSTEQVFLNPKLTLSELALRVGTNRTYLSNYINQNLGQTFFDYVNSMRIKHATEMLLTTNLTLEVIAEKSGFNSLSTFRRCFLEHYNTSPSSYRKEQAQNQ